jgi:hypothetical protein
MKYEYKTTEGTVGGRSAAGGYEDTDDPLEPDGEGWEMIGSAADAGYLYWFWRRPVDWNSPRARS